jgi:acyl-CoA synthetase (NDP forming)
MLEARSVAVVGASVKPGTLGNQMVLELLRGGFDGAIYPVNPSYERVEGLRCHPSMADVPEPVDLAILGVANHRIEGALREAAAAGARSAVTFSSLYEAEPPEPGLPPLPDRLATIAREHGMPFCGGNGMGFMNVPGRLRATGFLTPDDLPEGPVTFVSHSGSAFAAVAFNDRGIGFDLIVSSGNEIVTTMAEYLTFALARETTRVIAVLLETVRAPDAFVSSLALAAEREVPVVALKVGRTEGSKAMVTAHSGALAGEHGAFEAVFEAFGVHEVRTLDEMLDAIELFSSPRRVTSGSGIASVHDSGGERAMFADLASDLGVPFAPIADRTRERIAGALDPGLVAENPLDAWGTGIDADRIFRECLLALADDPETAALVFCVDLTRQGEPYEEGYLRVARDVFSATAKPLCVLSNLSSAVAREEAGLLRASGIPVLEGTDTGLRALRHLLDERTWRERPRAVAPEPVPAEVGDRWRSVLSTAEAVPEVAALRMLADYGVPAARAEAATTLEEATSVAAAIGYPVAVKTAMPDVAHKSDVDGVRLGVASEPALAEVYRDLSQRLGPEVTVAEMAPPGVEMALGIVRDPQFGPLVVVAAGGVLVEVLHDRRLLLPPVDADRARIAVDSLRVRSLLDGVRGSPPADVDALVRAIVRLSALAADLGDLLDALDANPVICSADGCVAVDALVVPSTRGR